MKKLTNPKARNYRQALASCAVRRYTFRFVSASGLSAKVTAAACNLGPPSLTINCLAWFELGSAELLESRTRSEYGASLS
jgi:hypothetical protein